MSSSFIFYESFADALRDLPSEEFKKCVMALCSYVFDNEEPEVDSAIVKIFFSMARPLLDANMAKKEAGCRGGRPRKTTAENEEQNKKPMVTEQKTIGFETENHRLSKSKPDVDVDKDVDVDRDVERDVEGERACASFFSINDVPELSEEDAASLGVPPALCEPVSRWVSNRTSRRETLTQNELRSFVSMVKSKARTYGAQAISDLIAETMSNGYKGIPWDRLERRARDKPEKSALDRLMEIEV